MEGITILATNVINNGDFLTGIIAIIGSIVMIGMILWSIAETNSYGFLAFLVFVVLLLGFGITQITDKTTFVQYKITVSDDVSLNEFDDKYEIVSRDGDIYTVVEKDIE